MRTRKQILVVGGGISGITAALQLADSDHTVILVERQDSLGGHAALFSCKATDRCVECGACLVEQRIDRANRHPNIEVSLRSHVNRFEKNNATGRFLAEMRCDSSPSSERRIEADAVVFATGFQTYDPTGKPFGYRRFANVVTTLELEQMLRFEGKVKKPSDGEEPDRIAFIQCVGSRDAALGHLWCSKLCCATALRMANRMKWDRPATEIALFYIDIQTFGRDFEGFYEKSKQRIRFIRTIPGDILPADNSRLLVSYFDGEAKEELFDLVVLSVGMMPDAANYDLLKQLGLSESEETFSSGYENISLCLEEGVFTAGALLSPMGIADAAACGLKAAEEAMRYLVSASSVSIPERPEEFP